jgi:glycosyltransferase involved in cell wall biosynthesis
MAKVSVLIIAHNEEKYVEKCLDSIMNQSITPDEIILIAHNCTDKTEEIASTFPKVKTISYQGPKGIIYARIKGVYLVSGDIIACIDGDSYAEKNWIEVMSKLLKKGNILVGSWIKIKGTIFGNISNIFIKYLCVLNTKNRGHWIWGPSFAFWGKNKEKVISILERSIELTNKLKLSRNPDDYWLALFMGNEGKLEITNKTNVVCYEKQKTSFESLSRNFDSFKNGMAMRSFWKGNRLNYKNFKDCDVL